MKPLPKNRSERKTSNRSNMPEDQTPLSSLTDEQADQLMIGARLAAGDWEGREFFEEALKEYERLKEDYANPES